MNGRDLGKRIKSRRTKLSLTQPQLAARVGRGHPWLSALERGQGNPPAEIITALAIALDEDPAEYLRLAGRAVLQAEDIIPAPPLDPRVTRAIEEAVGRALAHVQARLDANNDMLTRLTALAEAQADVAREEAAARQRRRGSGRTRRSAGPAQTAAQQ